MNKHRLIGLLICISITGLLLLPGCGKKNEIDTEEVTRLWEDQVLLMDNYITGIEKTTGAEGTVKLIETFTAGLEETIPRFNRWFLQYPAFKETMDAESKEGKLPPEYRDMQDSMFRLTAVALFTQNFVKMKTGKFKDRAVVKEALGKLEKLGDKFKLEDTLKSGQKVVELLEQLAYGRWEVDIRVEKFFKRLRDAGVTSRMKLTMQYMFVLGRAMEAYKKEQSKLPGISGLEELKDIPEFTKYFRNIENLRVEDGWGNYLKYKAEGGNYWIGSCGSDGSFSGFEQKGLYNEMEGKDVIYSGGRFVFAPAALMRKTAQKAQPAK